MIMRLAPIGAFGAMAFTVGQYGVGALLSLGKLMAGVYLTCLFFVVVVLGAICRLPGFSLFRFLRYIREEILIVLGTSSSESALPRLMGKLEHLGCSQAGRRPGGSDRLLVQPRWTSIYMTMAAMFVAQASGCTLSLGEQLGDPGVLLLTSKGAAAVTGSGFVTLAATLAAYPVDSSGRPGAAARRRPFHVRSAAITNLIGNAVATVVDRALGGRPRPGARASRACRQSTGADRHDSRDRCDGRLMTKWIPRG